MNRRQLFQGTAAAAVTLSLGYLVTKSPSVAWKWDHSWMNYDWSLATTLTLWIDGVERDRIAVRSLMPLNKSSISDRRYCREIERHKRRLQEWAYRRYGVTTYLV